MIALFICYEYLVTLKPFTHDEARFVRSRDQWLQECDEYSEVVVCIALTFISEQFSSVCVTDQFRNGSEFIRSCFNTSLLHCY